MTRYFVADNGESRGPYTLEQVAALIREGRVGTDTPMWMDGLADWQAASRVLAGTGLLAAPAAPPPLPALDAAHHAGPTETPVIAAYGRRAAASLIDGLVLILPLCLLFLLPRLLIDDDGAAFAVGEPLALLASLAYYGLLQGRDEGATLGKRAVGIRVVRDDGRALGTRLALGRYALLMLFGMLLIPYLVPLFNARRKGLHDMICGTTVIEGVSDRHPRLDFSASHIGGWGALTWVLVALLLLVPFAMGMLAALAIPAYQDYAVRSQVALAIERARTVSEQVAAYHERRGRWPLNAGELGLAENTLIAGVATMRLGEHGTVSLTFTPRPIEGVDLEIRIDDRGHRQCVTSLPRKFTGRACSPAGINAPRAL